jgi:glycosyltransferase involved in cell wall biosynthesis
MSHNICIYFRLEPEKNRYFFGDKYLIKLFRFLFRKKKISGVQRVFINLCKSFDVLKVKYVINKPFNKLKENDIPIVIGVGKYSLENYNKNNPIIAGIALMTHPAEWPNLCNEYPIAKYLQHSNWANNVYKKHYGEKICDTWFAGIDTEFWKSNNESKKIDFLVYKKFHWDKDTKTATLFLPILDYINKKGFSYQIIEYGNYLINDYKYLLNKSKYLLLFSEHESQGFAYCEALSMNVPVLAWDQGLCLDPNRFKWNDPVIEASSVPFLIEEGGLKFKTIEEFKSQLNKFIELNNSNIFKPRDYIIENLSLEKSGERMLEIIKEVYPDFENSLNSRS